MRERINRLAKGIIDSEIPEILLEPEKIEGSVQAGNVAKAEFHVLSRNRLHMKGLAYSDNMRVKVLNHAFGGTRNRIAYEVDSTYLDNGDEIKGSFWLVTNGGEVEIPYSFRVDLGPSGQVLGSLETPADFCRLVKNDMETALRLFEYQDFVEAPFMKDMRIRAVYDGLKGRSNRGNLLEEFLVGIQVKAPVTLSAEEAKRFYEYPVDGITDSIIVKKKSWGYAGFEVQADGSFIELPKKWYQDSDFKDGECQVLYHISPEQLHRGHNLGAVRIRSPKEIFVVPMQIEGDETVDYDYVKLAPSRAALYQYLTLRLEYEAGIYESGVLEKKMAKVLEELIRMPGDKRLYAILQAEFLLLSGRFEQARILLDECRELIVKDRADRLDYYCFFQYMYLKVHPDHGQMDSLIRLVRKYLAEGRHSIFMYLLQLRLEPELLEVPAAVVMDLKRQFALGCRSPFLYQEVCSHFKAVPGLLNKLDKFELHCLYYGIKKGSIGMDLALQAARLVQGVKHFQPLYYRFLVCLYEKYPEKEILASVCSLLIKGNRVGKKEFPWYEKALKEGISLTRLYEYFLYSLPKDYGHLMPKEVLLYFSYDHDLDNHSKSVLYKNILQYMNSSTELYKTYEREMEQFAMNQLFESRINSRLALLYDHMIYKDLIDENMAKVLPSILKSYRVNCSNDQMKYVIVRYEELMDEDAFPLTEGAAYIPLYSENSVLLFQDAYGNRYTDVKYYKTPVWDNKELEEKCFEIYPDHPMLCLQACRRIMEAGIETEEEAAVLERALTGLKLTPLFEKKLTSCLIDYYQKKAQDEDSEGMADIGCLLMLEKEKLPRNERVSVCETLISQNYLMEAYEMIEQYGIEGISSKRLLKFCTRMILQNLFDEDARLLGIAWEVFRQKAADSIILDYLCEHFNGTSEQMYRILNLSVRNHVETYDLEERLTAQMLFSGATARLDDVFDLYATRKKTSESIVRAYFTMKGMEYFLDNKVAKDKVFAYLEGAVNSTMERGKVPTIYLLALTKYYASLPVLTEEQKQLCSSIMEILLEEEYVFPYFRRLAGAARIPEDILDKAMIEYHGSRDSNVTLKIRILPEEEEFHKEEMKRMYQGIFVKKQVLFEGEIMEYEIYEEENGNMVKKQEGNVSCESLAPKMGDSRFASLNEMGLCLSMKEETGLKKQMREYLIKNGTVEELFPIL